MAGKAAQTSREMPATITFLRPVASIAAATLGSSQALTVDRSMILMPGRASTSSGKVGPHTLSTDFLVKRELPSWNQLFPQTIHSSHVSGIGETAQKQLLAVC